MLSCNEHDPREPFKRLVIRVIKTSLLYTFILLLQGCMTGSVLRTAQVLEKNQLEISGGIAKSAVGNVTQVVIAAYGVTHRFELESRWEDGYISFTPRLQLLKSDRHGIDCLAFLEVGYGPSVSLLGGGGIMFGKKFHDFSPYIAYRYRHYQNTWGFGLVYRNAHFVKLGSRYYLPPFWKKSPPSQSAWFIGAEGGLTLFPTRGLVIWEWDANVGFNF